MTDTRSMGKLDIPNYSRILFHDGEAWNVTVPELDNSTTFGDTPERALAMAQEMIEGYVESLVKHGEPIPPANIDPLHQQAV